MDASKSLLFQFWDSIMLQHQSNSLRLQDNAKKINTCFVNIKVEALDVSETLAQHGKELDLHP